jgi:hypothetical protein
MLLEGGCLCGALRFRLDDAGAIADFCHCETCRRAHGAPLVAWLQVPPDQFRLLSGRAGSFESAPGSRRHFCVDCGSQVYMSDAAGRSLGVAVACLDDPEAVRPQAHGFAARKLSWLELADALPRYPEAPPYDE